MRRRAVRLNGDLRAIALLALVSTLTNDGMTVLIAALDDHHLHVLAEFPDHEPRRRLGWAKLYATKKVKEHLASANAHGDAVGFPLLLRLGEGLWAKRGKIVPVRDRSHQLNVLTYIYEHGLRGSVVFVHPDVERYARQVLEARRRAGKPAPPRWAAGA